MKKLFAALAIVAALTFSVVAQNPPADPKPAPEGEMMMKSKNSKNSKKKSKKSKKAKKADEGAGKPATPPPPPEEKEKEKEKKKKK